MNFKKIAIIIPFCFIGCHDVKKYEDGKTEKIIEKCDSISQKVERSRNALDSITDKAIEEAENKFNSLNQTIEEYRKNGSKNNIIKTKIINKIDTFYFEKNDGVVKDAILAKDVGEEYNQSYINEIKNLTEENARLREEIRNLKTKKDQSIVYLKESLLRIDPIKKNWLNEEIKTKKAKNVQGIKIQFSLGDKEIENGNDLYLCISDPDMIEEGEGGDTILTEEGITKKFIKRFSLDPNNPFLFLYFQTEKFKTGTYFFEFYQDGSRVKFGSVTLTKGLL